MERAQAGEEIVITRRGEPAARLVLSGTDRVFPSLAGAWQGRVEIADAFDELPGDLGESLGMHPLNLLLDTHVVLWWMAGKPDQIGERARAAITTQGNWVVSARRRAGRDG